MYNICNKIEKARLIVARKYRQNVAGIWLILYGFIAAPAVLWQHLDYDSAIRLQPTSVGSTNENLAKCPVISPEINCKVCSHNYSTYNDNAILPKEALLVLVGVKNGVYRLPAVSSHSFSPPNKGPPTLSHSLYLILLVGDIST